MHPLFLCLPYCHPPLARTGCEIGSRYVPCDVDGSFPNYCLVSWFYHLLLPLGTWPTLHLTQMTCSFKWPMTYWHMVQVHPVISFPWHYWGWFIFTIFCTMLLFLIIHCFFLLKILQLWVLVLHYSLTICPNKSTQHRNRNRWYHIFTNSVVNLISADQHLYDKNFKSVHTYLGTYCICSMCLNMYAHS
jgi:hypothetical protein